MSPPPEPKVDRKPVQPVTLHPTITTTAITSAARSHLASYPFPPPAEALISNPPATAPLLGKRTPRKLASSPGSYRDDHVAMEAPKQLKHQFPYTPPPAETSVESDSTANSTVDPLAEPNLSPRNFPLPQSPHFDSDSDIEANDSDGHSPSRRPARLSRSDDEDHISKKPIIHQQPLAFRSRNHSPSTPLPRPHTSAGVGLITPLMQRAHSSPGVDSSGRFVTPQYHPSQTAPRRPPSPLTAGSRRRSPLRSAMEESYPSWSGLAIEPNIPEHAELDLSEDFSHISPVPTYHNTFPRSRRRPTSPLHPSASAPTLHIHSSARAISPHTTGTSSPGSASDKRYFINDSYPTNFSYSYPSTSSMPSTPSSFRSRSPSISSLETIEDSPDAEEAAMIAAEEDAKDRMEEIDTGEVKRRASLELRGNTLRSNKERKRWSVCGAERRADFSLEVIEE